MKRGADRRFVKSVFKYNPSVSLRDPAPLTQGSLFFTQEKALPV
jgi:hypothetical protein